MTRVPETGGIDQLQESRPISDVVISFHYASGGKLLALKISMA